MQMDSPYDTVHASGMIVTDLIWADTDVFEYFIQRLTMMSVYYRSVMRIVPLNQYMAVKTSHLRNRENAIEIEFNWIYPI